jgi:hypothetical protein
MLQLGQVLESVSTMRVLMLAIQSSILPVNLIKSLHAKSTHLLSWTRSTTMERYALRWRQEVQMTIAPSGWLRMPDFLVVAFFIPTRTKLSHPKRKTHHISMSTWKTCMFPPTATEAQVVRFANPAADGVYNHPAHSHPLHRIHRVK